MDEGVIIVTGASRGIGAAIAECLVGAGYTVACLSRSGELPAAAADARASPRWLAYAADVTNPGEMGEAMAHAAEGRRIVGLVNNAGLHTSGPSATLPLEEWERLMRVNATSVLIGCQAVYPYLQASGAGLIVNIGSFFDKLGVKQNLAYCASKAAVAAMTRVLAVEWASKSIQLMNVAPGYVVTDLNRDAMETGPLRTYLEKRIPGARPGTAADVAALVTKLFELKCTFLTGETLYIDGAQGIAH